MNIDESRTKKSINNIIGGLMFKLIALIFPFIIKAVMIKKLGVQYLGLNSLFTSILMVLSLSELGVGSALVYSMYKPMAENDEERICALLKVYKKFYRIIGVIISVVGLILLPVLRFLISGTYPKDINIYILYLIYLVNTALSYFLFAYKKSLWEASQKNGIESRLAAATNAGMYIAQILALIFTENYYVYIIFLPLSTLIQNLIRSVMVDRMYPQFECRGELEKGFIKELFVKIKALLGHKIGSTVITAADSIVISSILGLEILAIYGNYYQIINALIGVVSVIYTAVTASIGNSIIVSADERVYSNFETLTFMNSWLVGWFSVCLYCLYQPFMKIWMGEKMLFSNYIVILFAVYFYSWLVRRIGLTYKDAAGMWEQDFWKPYVGVVVNIVVNIVLCKTIGVAGVLLSTIIVMVFIYFPWETWALFKYLFKRSSKEYLLRMFFYLIVTIIVALVTDYLCKSINIYGILGLVIKMVICSLLPNIMYLIAYFKLPEFQDGKRRVFNIINSKRN